MVFGNNLSLSVVKRERRDLSEVRARLNQRGWQETGTIGDNIFYYENAGINITVVDAPRAVLIFPSGPIRGRFFNRAPFGITQDSGLGMGTPQEDQGQTSVQNNRQSSRNHTRMQV
jgi:hypothetical protein